MYVPLGSGLIGDTRLSTTDIADLMEIKPASLRQLLTRGGFPTYDFTEGRANLWRASTVFSYLLIHRPELSDRIPRLYPRIPQPNPAAYLGARSVRIGGSWPREYVAYVWRPSDGGGEVALAYAIAGNPARDDLQAILDDLDVTAVATPSTYLDPIIDIDPGLPMRYQPSLENGYRDRSTASIDNNPSWSDLAYLLQTDVPWWPLAYRRRDVMLQWRPGTGPAPVVPYSGNPTQDPTALLRLAATTHTSSATNDPAITGFFSWWATHIALATDEHPNEGETHYATTLGITVPAFGVSPVPGHPPLKELAKQPEALKPTDVETAIILHAQADPLDIADAAPISVNFALWDPWIVEIREISTNTGNPLAQRWLDRLVRAAKPYDPATRTEIGYVHVARYARGRRKSLHPLAGHQPDRLIDPLNPDCWIVDFSDTVYVTVGRSIPAATGVLETLHLDRKPDRDNSGAAFCPWWSDSDGHSWPLPGDSYQAGYSGGGPTNLASAALHLAADATATINGIDRESTGFADLFRKLTDPDYPTRWTRTDTADGQWALQPEEL